MLQKGLAPVLIILLIAAVGGFLLYTGKIIITPSQPTVPYDVYKSKSPSSMPTSTLDTSKWKTYDQKDIKLSFRYPPNWNIEELNKDKYKEGNWSGVRVKGEQGDVELLWGWGFGGACPGGYEDISIKNKKLHTCHGLDQEGYERWNQIGGVEGKQMGNSGRVGFTAKASAYPPSQANRNTILKIISSIDLANWE